MPNHFSSIGIVIDSDDLVDLVLDLFSQAQTIGTDVGQYMLWQDPSGAQVWIQLSASGEIVGVNPHFEGSSRVPIGLTHQVSRPDGNPLDGSFHAWAEPTDETPEGGAYPFIFDSPDPATYGPLQLPTRATAQLALFAHEVSIFADEADYDAKASEAPRFATRSFIPSGLFPPDHTEETEPVAIGIVTGIVQAAEFRQNSYGGDFFWWAALDTLGGTFDAVFDPELVAPNELKPGNIVQGEFWISGRIESFG